MKTATNQIAMPFELQVVEGGMSKEERRSEAIRSHAKKRYIENKEKLINYAREYYKQNRNEIIERQKKYQQSHKYKRIRGIRRKGDKSKKTARKYTLKRKYGLTHDAYNEMLLKQGNKCAICGVSFSDIDKRNRHVDHCHATRKIRGLLCISCNHGIGKFKDNT